MTTIEFVQNNLLLVGVALVSGGMLLWQSFGDKISGVSQVGTAEATRLINDDALVLDVREDKEWAEGHLPNAKHIPLAQLPKRISELDKYKDRPVVVSCRSGHRSASACRTLKKNGFQQAHNLTGGIIAWEQANLPIIKK
ncbi:MAG: rhodanese-like domain-containing protein [Thiobacillaceae bacterium]|jgi:rhodanese-related sulfurtransferase